MRPRPFLIHALVLALAGTAAASPPVASGTHEDPRVGFEIKVPKGWDQVPLHSGEEWIVAAFQSDEEYRVLDEVSGGTFVHRPQLRVIAFLDAVIHRPDLTGEDAIQEDDEKVEVKLQVARPYRDYKDYMERTYPAGFYFSDEGEDEVHDVPVETYEVTVDDPPMRLVTWVYSVEVGKVAVQFEVQQKHYDKVKGDIERTLESFRPIERTVPLGIESQTNGVMTLTLLKSLTPEERMQRRKADEQEAWEKAVASLPEGWDTDEYKGVKILNHADERHAKKVAERVRATMDWLDETFPGIGEGEYVRTPIVRLCADLDEEQAYSRSMREGGGDVTDLSLEIVTHKDKTMGAESSEWSWISRRTLNIWLRDKDLDLYINRPPWIFFGLVEVTASADVRGKKLKFEEGWLEQMRDQFIKDDPIDVQSLMRMDWVTFASMLNQRDLRPLVESASLVRYFVDGGGARSRKTRGLLGDYMANYGQVLAEIRERERAERAAERELAKMDDEEDAEEETRSDRPESEDEEEAYLEAQREAAALRARELLDASFERTFAEWDSGDWSDFQRSYEREL